MLAQLGSAIIIIPLIAILESVAIAKAFGEIIKYHVLILPSLKVPQLPKHGFVGLMIELVLPLLIIGLEDLVDKCVIRDGGEIQGWGQKLPQFIEECEHMGAHTKCEHRARTYKM